MRLATHSFAALSALVLAPVGLVAAATRRSFREGLGERLGSWPQMAPGAIWIHGASVGEAVAATRLADALRDRGERVFFSTTTLTGRATLRDLRPEQPCALAPLDHPWAVARALDRLAPAALVLVETEIWPVRVAIAEARDIPVVIVSGRISDRSFPRYRRCRRLLRSTMKRIAAVGARSPLDAERFAALGVPKERILVTGDLKFEPAAAPPLLADDLKLLFDALDVDGVPVLVAGSTHAGEEELALEALARAEQSGRRALLVIAPRHPERFDEVAECIRAAGRCVVRRTQLAESDAADKARQPGSVLLLDSIGELAGVYRRATVAFVGGSLVPRGGHNVLEPVFVGTPVLFGPHVDTARDAAARVLETGAGREVADGEALFAAVTEALSDPQVWRRCGLAGRAQLEANRGCAARSAALVLAQLVGKTMESNR